MAIQNWIVQYGYVAIYFLLAVGIVGLPVPDETLLVICGYLIFKQRLNAVWTIVAALGGSLTGITGSYVLGRTAGLAVIHSKAGRWLGITDANLHRVHDWFSRIGHWTLFIGYYIPGVRHFTAVVAGTAELEFPLFALYAYSGACVWVGSFLFLGYHFGDNWEAVFDNLEHHLRLVSVVAAILMVLYAAFHYSRRRRRSGTNS